MELSVGCDTFRYDELGAIGTISMVRYDTQSAARYGTVKMVRSLALSPLRSVYTVLQKRFV